jgi:hypothetical protein
VSERAVVAALVVGLATQAVQLGFLFGPSQPAWATPTPSISREMTKYRRAPMRLKRPHVATLDEVAITREADGAVIAYKDRTVRHHSRPARARCSPDDQPEILDRYNAGIRATEALAADLRRLRARRLDPRRRVSRILRDI